MKPQEDYIRIIGRYREHKDLPLWVDYVPMGEHPERAFHTHHFMEVVLVRGKGCHILENFAIPISERDILIIPPGFNHAYEDCSGLEILNLVYEPEQLFVPHMDGMQLPLFFRLFPQGSTFDARTAAAPALQPPQETFDELWQAIMLLRQHINTETPGRNFLSLGRFLQIIGDLAKLGSQENVWNTDLGKLQDTIAYMSSSLHKELNMDILAQRTMMSTRNFYRYFKEMTGTSPLQYLISLRVHKAVQLLRCSALSMEEIAVECGFCDANYLARIIKKQLNISPRQLRNSSGPR